MDDVATNLRRVDAQHVLARLQSILEEVWDGYQAGLLTDSDAPLISLGVDSITLVILLDRVEGEFAIEWDPDNPPGAYSSLRSIANLVTDSKSSTP